MSYHFTMYTALINHIQNYIQLDENSIQEICTHFKSLSIDNKEYLVKEGQICKSYYFVKKGCLRMFYNNDKGFEQIIQFAIEGWWLTDYFSIDSQQASEYNTQAIEASEILSIDKASFDKLTEKAPLLERYFRVMAQRGLAASQFRLKQIFSLSKEEMYLHFNSLFPYFIQRVPQYMLASYLGITPEYLSEIKKKSL